MKKIHRILGISLICLVALTFIFANVQRVKPTLYPKQGEYIKFGSNAGDTIVVSDTLTYVFSVEHMNDVNPVINLFWDKIGSGTATCTVKFWESMDGTNYAQCLKGAALGAYTKSISGSADQYLNWSFKQDTAYFDQRFLKIQFITSSTASVKAKLTGYAKFNIQ